MARKYEKLGLYSYKGEKEFVVNGSLQHKKEQHESVIFSLFIKTEEGFFVLLAISRGIWVLNKEVMFLRGNYGPPRAVGASEGIFLIEGSFRKELKKKVKLLLSVAVQNCFIGIARKNGLFELQLFCSTNRDLSDDEFENLLVHWVRTCDSQQ
jgi:hypothetical protein